MSKVLTNLTLPSVVQVIEEVLEIYPDHPYQQVFAIPEMRQKLTAFVLTRIHNIYAAIDEPTEQHSYADSVPIPNEERLHIESIVHQGIHTVLSENPMKMQTQIPDQISAGLSASHWFG